MSIRDFVNRLIAQSKRASPEELAQLIGQASLAPFAADLLEADEALWGSFWQGDVIAPGYRLPAVELALLRATRLERAWPEETSVAQFLADLHQTMADPQAGIWTLAAAGEPCIVFASVGGQSLATVAWYCASTGYLHAGYRSRVGAVRFSGAVEQRPLVSLSVGEETFTSNPGEVQFGLPEDFLGKSLAARLDAKIRQIRAHLE